MFNRVCIIGFGLIGSSIARAMRAHQLCNTIICADKDQIVCDRVMALKLAENVTVDCAEAVKDADLVILCVPVGAFSEVSQLIGPHLKAGAIVTDTGSVKQSVIKDVKPYLPVNVSFIPGHPVAGMAESGPDAGFTELFKDRWVILTPEEKADPELLKKIVELWQACGAKVEMMSADRHDLILGTISHLPQMVAYSLINSAADLEGNAGYDMIKFFGGGFKDTTRIAGSDPAMWRDICLHNKDTILKIFENFREHMDILEEAIAGEDAEKLHSLFSQARITRREKIDHV